MTPAPQPQYYPVTPEELSELSRLNSLFERKQLIGEIKCRWKDRTSHSSGTSAETVPVYEYPVHLPLKNIPSITRRKLALNDIGKDEDGFIRLGFELRDGDVIRVLRQQERERG